MDTSNIEVQSPVELRAKTSQFCSTDKVAAGYRVPYLARFDNLTGLHSRMALREKLADWGSISDFSGKSFALILLDLDGFGEVNNTNGQASGDVCLQAVAQHVTAAVGPNGFIARMGEDEFAVLLQGHTRRSLNEMVEAIQEAIALPVNFGGQVVDLTSSIGIAVRCDGRRFNADEMIRDAELALQEAKAAGKNCHRTFRRALLATCTNKHDSLRGVRHALALGQLELHYQPKIRLRDGAHAGFEALLRWNKNGDLLSPDSFLAAFEDPSLSTQLGNYVIAAAVDQARQWMLAGTSFNSIAINLSAGQFRDPTLANRILAAIVANHLHPSTIEVEVTEGVFLSASSRAVLNTCQALSEAGVRIAFDDFGTGFASLTHLRDFPVDVIKIDRSFISHLGEAQNSTLIVNAIVSLAHNLSMSVVAEGVETRAQADFLKVIGCDLAQGFLFRRPQPAVLAAQQLDQPPPLPT